MRGMTHGILATILVLALLPAPGSAEDVQGQLETKEGQKLLRVWGTHVERGYAAGYLAGGDAVKLFKRYVSTFFGWSQYNLLAAIYSSNFTTPPEFDLEAEALLDGARAAGVDLAIPELGRELLAVDLAVMSSIPDLSFLGRGGPDLFCSSLAAWDTGLVEPGFDGELVHTRNLEWSDTDDHDLADSTLVMVSIPAEPTEQPWVALTFPGMWGSLSGMNAAGLAVTLNMGNHKEDPVPPCHPILMTLRGALEKRDANGDGACDWRDVEDSVSPTVRGSSYILHCSMPPSLAGELAPSVVIEANANRLAVRVDSHDPAVSPDFLLATNHHRRAYDPVFCSRYSTLQTAVTDGRPVDTQEAYDIVRLVSQGVWTLQSMILRPDPRDLWITHITAAGTQSPLVYFSWDELIPPGSPTPTPPPTATPEPTAEPTGVPTAEPTVAPTPELGVRLEVPVLIHPGEEFQVRGWLDNPDTPRTDVPVFFILDVHGEYWFWDDWTYYHPPESNRIDYRVMNVPTGSTPVEVIPAFSWPDTGAGADQDLYFHGAMLDAGMSQVLGRIGSASWAYGPAG